MGEAVPRMSARPPQERLARQSAMRTSRHRPAAARAAPEFIMVRISHISRASCKQFVCPVGTAGRRRRGCRKHDSARCPVTRRDDSRGCHDYDRRTPRQVEGDHGERHAATADGKPATIYDVAARAGVSKSLVSLVLQRSPKVSEQRREAVLRAIQELDYRPSTAAVSLAGTRSRTIGVVLDDFRNQWFVDLLTGLREALQDQGHRLVVADRFLNTGLDASPSRASCPCASRASSSPASPTPTSRSRRACPSSSREGAPCSPRRHRRQRRPCRWPDGGRAPARARAHRIGFGGRALGGVRGTTRRPGGTGRLRPVARLARHPVMPVEPPRRPEPRPSGTCSTPTPT